MKQTKNKDYTTKHLKENEETKKGENKVRNTHTPLLSPVWHCGSEGGALSALL